MACVLVATTLPTREAAVALADAVIGGHLAACGQVSGPLASVWRWRGAVERGEEWRCELKTTRDRLAALEAAITARHPYELPELTVAPLAGSERYLAWIEEAVRADG
jgi:periplasmic divalent cation tolerance protein